MKTSTWVFRIFVYIFVLTTAGCGYSYFVKEQTASFAQTAKTAIDLIKALPERVGDSEAELQQLTQTIDPNCIPHEGIYYSLIPIPNGNELERLVPEKACRKPWETLRDCQQGGLCTICNQKDPIQRNRCTRMAQASRMCIDTAVLDNLPTQCRNDHSVIYRKIDLSAKKDGTLEKQDAAKHKANQSFADLVASAAEYVSALSDLAAARDKSSAAHVKKALDDLQTTVDHTNSVLKILKSDATITVDDKTKSAVSGLATLLVEWVKVSDDEEKIRVLVATKGDAFEAAIGELSTSAEFLQTAYIPALAQAKLTRLQGTFKGDASSIGILERNWYLSQMASTKKTIDAINEEKPLSAMLVAIAEAHKGIRQILSGHLTPEQQEAVLRENIRQFTRLVSSLKAIYQLF